LNKDNKISAIADFIISNETHKSSRGFLITNYSDIPREISSTDFIRENIKAIENILDKHKKISAVMHNDNSFNIIYNLDFRDGNEPSERACSHICECPRVNHLVRLRRGGSLLSES